MRKLEELVDGRDALREYRFFQSCEYFLRNWGPADERERAEFAAGLMVIMRQAFEDGEARMLAMHERMVGAMLSRDPWLDKIAHRGAVPAVPEDELSVGDALEK